MQDVLLNENLAADELADDPGVELTPQASSASVPRHLKWRNIEAYWERKRLRDALNDDLSGGSWEDELDI